MSDISVTKAAEVAAKIADGWEYVTIPDRDIHGLPFDGFWNNKDHFGPGTHLVDKDTASSLKERMAVWQAMCIRMLQPYRDARAQLAADKSVTT